MKAKTNELEVVAKGCSEVKTIRDITVPVELSQGSLSSLSESEHIHNSTDELSLIADKFSLITIGHENNLTCKLDEKSDHVLPVKTESHVELPSYLIKNEFLENVKSNDNSSDEFDEEESDNSTASDCQTRGPDRNSHISQCHHPYNQAFNNYHYTPNISPSPNESFLNKAIGLHLNIWEPLEQNYENISVSFTNQYQEFTTTPCIEASQLLLSGGGQIFENNLHSNEQWQDKEKINVIKESLKLHESGMKKTPLNQVIEVIDSDPPLSLDFDKIQNEILDMVEGKVEEVKSGVSSPASQCSSDQQVYSPSYSLCDETTIFSLYHDNCQSYKVDECHSESNSVIATFEEWHCSLPIPILPRTLDMSSDESSNRIFDTTSKGKKPGSRNVHLSLIPKKDKDRYHKKMLTFLKEGLGKKSEEQCSYLHCIIMKELSDFAVYFVHMLNNWMCKNPDHEGLKGIGDVSSFINSRDVLGRTALYMAAMLNLPKVVDYLLECNADVTIADMEDGQTPLHIAAERGEVFLEVVKVICDHKSSNNIFGNKNFKGQTALHVSVSSHLFIHDHGKRDVINNLNIAKQLLLSGAKLSIQDDNGYTPIHLAVQKRCPELLETLFMFGNDFKEALNIKDHKMRTAVDLASSIYDTNDPQRKEIIEKLMWHYR